MLPESISLSELISIAVVLIDTSVMENKVANKALDKSLEKSTLFLITPFSTTSNLIDLFVIPSFSSKSIVSSIQSMEESKSSGDIPSHEELFSTRYPSVFFEMNEFLIEFRMFFLATDCPSEVVTFSCKCVDLLVESFSTSSSLKRTLKECNFSI